MEKRVISTQLQEEDYKIESSLRPQRLEDYIGQEKIKSNMKVYIEAAKARQESLDSSMKEQWNESTATASCTSSFV